MPLASGVLLDSLRAQFQPQVDARGLQLDVTDCSAILLADPVLLQRVLRNLLENAVRYTDAGTISLHCEPIDANRCCVVVQDTGVGIPEEAREEVFSEYFQICNQERNRSKGLGLGLSIVKRLCQLTDMPLTMHSQSGLGTRFELLVPLASAHCESDLPRADTGARISYESACILLIDDEVQVLRSMTLMLEDWGCRVLTARTGREALKAVALSDAAPALILSDYRLPNGENGVQVVAQLRDLLGRCSPAALITGDTSPERLRDVVASKLDILHKPVDPRELHALLSAVLRDRASGSAGHHEAVLSATGSRVAATSCRMDSPCTRIDSTTMT